MRLLSIKTENFRTLEHLDLTFSKDYCTISGRNNAGKSSVIRLLSILFRMHGPFPWTSDEYRFSYEDDRTQWAKEKLPIKVTYQIELSREADSALISFIEKMAGLKAKNEVVGLDLRFTISEDDVPKVAVTFDGNIADEKSAKEIDKKIKDSNLLFLYNSTIRHDDIFYGSGRRRMFYDFIMSEHEKKQLEDAGKSVERRLRQLAKQHKEGLNTMLGKLSERFDVEFTPPDKFGTRHMPVGINLKDKHVEVPLDDWGSGTQNRTQIMMVILRANRIRTTASLDDKITPIIVIEEPESFLHPSAQSEFGRVLRAFSQERGIQIIVTTHSPYMLNRESPESNILLYRNLRRHRAYETRVEQTNGEGWMAPFAEHLGIDPSEFSSWRPVFSGYKSKVLLVEGEIDKDYFTFFQKDLPPGDRLSPDIEVVPYGGKDTLKNTLLVQFVLRQFDRVFITYDLDAHDEVKNALTRLGLKEFRDFLALGIQKPGRDCIEGIMPDRVLSAVNGRETDLVMKLTSPERREAKNKLKKLYYEEFKKHANFTPEELKGIARIVRALNHQFALKKSKSTNC